VVEVLKKYRKLLGFVTFGGLAGGVYAAVLAISVDFLGWSVFIGSAVAYALAIPVSYFGNRWVTYRSRNVMAFEAFRFVVVQVINLVLTSAVVHVSMEQFALPTYAGILVAFLAAPVISLILFEVWVYRQRRDASTLNQVSSESSSHR
jgi:putative flippase GtrA